jgi:hypothetical protein
MQTMPEPQQAEAHAREMLAAAEDNFRGIMTALVQIRRRLEAGECEISEAEIRRGLSGVHKAIQAVFDERKKLDDIRLAGSGPVAERALDLGRAEQQVRRQLARIRADLHGDAVPPVSG